MLLRHTVLGVLAGLITSHAEDLCLGDCSTDASGKKQCTFTSVVDIFASEWGYYTFKECGFKTNPTLGMEVGVTYYFDQSDVSNYYHPLGFAYAADGAHADEPELEPGICPNFEEGCPCLGDMSCPAPMYMLNDEYLGSYSNNGIIKNATVNDDNFGLDDYEPLFFYPIMDWTDMGKFSVALKINEGDDFKSDIFYFCHIHEYMSGRIKVLSNDGLQVQEEDYPIPYKYYEPSQYDKACGTSELNEFQLPHHMCPDKFVCDIPEDNVKLQLFADCIDSMDCAMVSGMTNGVKAEKESVLFIHQMIPHHQNAVNMAKALLKTGTVDCDDIMNEDDPNCDLQRILRDIIVTQNHQIQGMRAYLEAFDYPEEDQCVRSFESTISNPADGINVADPADGNVQDKTVDVKVDDGSATESAVESVVESASSENAACLMGFQRITSAFVVAMTIFVML